MAASKGSSNQQVQGTLHKFAPNSCRSSNNETCTFTWKITSKGNISALFLFQVKLN